MQKTLDEMIAWNFVDSNEKSVHNRASQCADLRLFHPLIALIKGVSSSVVMQTSLQ